VVAATEQLGLNDQWLGRTASRRSRGRTPCGGEEVDVVGGAMGEAAFDLGDRREVRSPSRLDERARRERSTSARAARASQWRSSPGSGRHRVAG
jgi:hypothetical protein